MTTGIGHQIQTLCPKKTGFTVDKIPDLSGKVMVVTGGSAGIGKETVRVLLTKNAKVYLAARNPQKANRVIEELRGLTGKEAMFLQLDLADLKSIKASAEEFISKESRLDVLFNNGGVMVPPIEELTVDGYDLQFGTNMLGPFYFTKLLTPLLLNTTQSSGEKVRIVNVSSSGHALGNMDYNAVRDTPERRKKGIFNLYAQSKIAMVMWSLELARRYGEQGIVTTSLNPGAIRTELQRHVSNLQQKLADKLLFDIPHGALTQLWAGTSPEGADLNGKYLIPWAAVGTPIKRSEDEEARKKLWAWLEEQVKDL